MRARSRRALSGGVRQRAQSAHVAGRVVMDFSLPDSVAGIRSAVRSLCARFPGEYWRGLEPDRYPGEFVAALTAGGWLGALVPEPTAAPGSR